MDAPFQKLKTKAQPHILSVPKSDPTFDNVR